MSILRRAPAQTSPQSWNESVHALADAAAKSTKSQDLVDRATQVASQVRSHLEANHFTELLGEILANHA